MMMMMMMMMVLMMYIDVFPYELSLGGFDS